MTPRDILIDTLTAAGLLLFLCALMALPHTEILP